MSMMDIFNRLVKMVRHGDMYLKMESAKKHTPLRGVSEKNKLIIRGGTTVVHLFFVCKQFIYTNETIHKLFIKLSHLLNKYIVYSIK